MLVRVPDQVSPKDKFITVYGRNPVLEALTDPALSVDKVLIAERARDVARIESAAAARDVPVSRVTAHRIKVLAGNGRHDQGVLAGVVLPRRGVPAIDPLVIKASAGVAFRAPVLRASTAVEACELLAQNGFEIVGLSGSDSGAWSVLDTAPPRRVAFVLGNESTGISAELRPLLTSWATIPMAGDVESLNVASAAAVVCFEWARHSR